MDVQSNGCASLGRDLSLALPNPPSLSPRSSATTTTPRKSLRARYNVPMTFRNDRVDCSRTGLIANARCCSGTSFFLLATAVQRASGAAAAWGGRLADLGCDPAGASRSWTYRPRQVATPWYIDEENALPRRTNQPVAQLAKLAERGHLASCVQGGAGEA